MRLRLLPIAVAAIVITINSCGRESPSSQTDTPQASLGSAPHPTYGTTYHVYDQTDFTNALSTVASGDRIIIHSSATLNMSAGCAGVTGTCLNGVRVQNDGTSAPIIGLPSGGMLINNVSAKGVRFKYGAGTGSDNLRLGGTSDIRIVDYFSGVSRRAISAAGTLSASDCVLWVNVESSATVNIDSCWFYNASGPCDDGNTTVSGGGTINVNSWKYGSTVYPYAPVILSKDVVAMTDCEFAYIRVHVDAADGMTGIITYGDNACSGSQQTASLIGDYYYAQIPNVASDDDFYWEITFRPCTGDLSADVSSTCYKAKLTAAVEDCPAPYWWPY